MGHGHERDEQITPLTGHDPALEAGPGYEVRDTNIRTVTLFGVGLVLLVVVTNLLLLGVYDRLYKQREPKETPTPAENLAAQMRAMRQTEDAALYGPPRVDRKTGVVRIPIDRAIDLVARRGVPRGKGPQTEIQINSREKNPETQ
jgi:hypothetical protein